MPYRRFKANWLKPSQAEDEYLEVDEEALKAFGRHIDEELERLVAAWRPAKDRGKAAGADCTPLSQA